MKSLAQAAWPAIRAAAVAVAAALFATAHVRAATLFDPALRFRTLTTEHFVIYFHQHESAVAARLAAIAEQTWQALGERLTPRPPRRTHVVLVDQTELANGYATPVPYDTIVLFATWPAGSEFIGNTDDWLRVAFTHEFTHIVHLDRSEGWARYVRGLFGRTLLAFPNLFLPTWQVEGLATYEESAITGEGRIHAGDFTAVVDEAARRGTFEPLDRVNGGLTDWPGGDAAYAYGAGFHDYLAQRFGAPALGRLADETARALPYAGSRAFRTVFGESLGDLWREYEASRPATAARVEGRQLTHRGFTVLAPRFDRASPRRVLYATRDADEFPSLYATDVDTGASERVATRYLGTTTAVGRDTIYFDQLEVRRNVALSSDLYAMSRTSGHVSALTRESRLLDPDLSPDESTIVAVRATADARDLVIVRPTAHAVGGVGVQPIVGEAGTYFNAPRWSPDGRLIAVERHVAGALSAVVIIDVESRRVRQEIAVAGARVVTPAWRPDGAAVVVAVAREGEPFNLFEVAVGTAGPMRQLTDTTGGATWPDISPDGSTIVFVGYTTAGFDLFVLRYPGAPATVTMPHGAERSDAPSETDTNAPQTSADARPPLADRDYSPWPTLTPTSWSPIVVSDGSQIRAGVGVGGIDVLGYHGWAASATWLVSAPAGARAPAAASPDWQIAYVYDRWRPTLFAAASSSTSFFAGPPTSAGTPTDATLRERQLEGGLLVPIRHVRVAHAAFASVLRSLDDYTFAAGGLTRDRTAIRGAWSTASAHVYGYSISPEDGVSLGTTIELVRRALGSSGDATTATLDVRAYVRGAARHHVIALRAAGGTSTGDATVGRTFLLGGSTADLGVVSFSSRAVGLLRGFASNSFAGRRAAVFNADYRVPIARPQRGAGTWPIFLHTIAATVFADAGDAWNTGGLQRATMKRSFGGELSTSIVAGYVVPFTLAGGVAWGHDPTGVVGSGATAYLRVGKAF